LEYFINAKAKGDLLFVIVNSDHQRAMKGSKQFQKEEERLFIVQHIKEVDQAFLSIDMDRTVCKTLEYLHQQFGSQFRLVFANGGDQTNQSIPEVSTCQELGIELIDGLGKKIQSSSWLLGKNNFKNRNL
jgi:glycerol-3-phosphate cytidylyltransferase-like family protein